MKARISVYIDDGRVFFYDVVHAEKAREHASEILRSGYRHMWKEGEMEWYPVHRIRKVKIESAGMDSMYYDETRGT